MQEPTYAARPDEASRSTLYLLSVVALFMIAAGLRLYRLGTQNLWYDELYSIDLSLQTYDQIITAAKNDMHPPLYYLLLKGWGKLFGSVGVGYRVFSVLTSLASLPLAFILARKLAGRWAAWWTVALLALAAHQVYYAQEVRQYSLVTFLGLGATNAYLAWSESRRNGWLGVYVLCGLAAIYSHYFGMLILVALNLHALSAFWFRWRSTGKPFQVLAPWIAAQVAIGLLYLPWIPVFLHQAQRGQPWRRPTPLVEALGNDIVFIEKIVVGYGTDSDALKLGKVRENGEVRPASAGVLMRWRIQHLAVALLLLLFALAVARAISALQQNRERELLAALLFLVPLAAGTLTALRQSIDLSRYLLIITPYFFLLVTGEAARYTKHHARTGLLAFCAGTMVLGLTDYYALPARDTDYRPVLAYIKANLKPGDSVVVDPDYMDVCLRHYGNEFGLGNALVSAEHRPATGEGQLEYLRSRSEVGRWWVILDYHSAWFSKDSLGNGLVTRSVRDFADRERRVRLLEVERCDGR